MADEHEDAGGPVPPEQLFQRAQFNFLALALLMSTVLGAILLFTWNHRRVRADERQFYESLGAIQFKFEPHESTQRFRQLRETLPEETPEETKRLALALFDRALNNVPQILKFQEEAAATQAMYSKSMISSSAWRSFRENDALVTEELDEVREEAEALMPGWGKAIWQQAVQQLQANEVAQARAAQETEEKKSQAKKAKRQKQKEKAKAQKPAAPPAPSPEELAEKARLELEALLEKENSSSVSGSTHSKSGKKKK